MIFTPLTRKAMQFAMAAHGAQTDKGGFPYIFHPYRVAESMTDEVSTCVALLHDVVEDSNIPIQTIRQEFSTEISDAVELLTHEKGVSDKKYLKRIKTNPIAKRVKLADIKDNTNFSRLLDTDSETIERLQQKYYVAYTILTDDK